MASWSSSWHPELKFLTVSQAFRPWLREPTLISFKLKERPNPDHMNHGDHEFHEKSGLLNDRIAKEGLRIARANGWDQFEIHVNHSSATVPGTPLALHCCILQPSRDDEIDEPTGPLLDAARELFHLFEHVNTPLAGMTMHWLPQEGCDQFRRETRYSYR